LKLALKNWSRLNIVPLPLQEMVAASGLVLVPPHSAAAWIMFFARRDHPFV
jgi:hypothetical protein